MRDYGDLVLSTLQARAVFCGWNPEDQGPVAEATERTLADWLHAAAWVDYHARRFIVNGEDPIGAPDFIEANRHDPETLYQAGALLVGWRWGGGAGGDVRRIA